LAEVAIGNGRINVAGETLSLDQPVRLQLLARDLILALEVPRGLSVRSRLHGVVTSVTDDDDHAALVRVDVGGPQVIARITASAARELALKAGLVVWVLVKTATLRGHVFRGPAAGAT
jgi:molybdate transport system ATP-binding protein